MNCRARLPQAFVREPPPWVPAFAGTTTMAAVPRRLRMKPVTFCGPPGDPPCRQRFRFHLFGLARSGSQGLRARMRLFYPLRGPC